MWNAYDPPALLALTNYMDAYQGFLNPFWDGPISLPSSAVWTSRLIPKRSGIPAELEEIML